MKSQIVNDTIEYQLLLDEKVSLNQFVNHHISFHYTGTINCIDCGQVTKKTYGQGFCYRCFLKSPLNAECIIRPELCRAHMGEGRDPEWEETHHNQPHVVYLSLTSGVKVGVTRRDQIPTRWIDQGATQAIVLAETPYRQIAGEIEVLLKEHMADKTNWRDMLKNVHPEAIDLAAEKEEALDILPEPLQEFYAEDDSIITLHYPVDHYPEKVRSVGFDKTADISGKLMGIKGQYLMFTDGRVLNIRKHNGYEVTFEAV